MEVVGIRGEDTFLIATGDGKAAMLQTRHSPPLIWPEQSLRAQLELGGWEPYEGDPEPILHAAEEAQPVNPRHQDLIDRGFTRGRRPKGTVKVLVGPHARHLREKLEADARERGGAGSDAVT